MRSGWLAKAGRVLLVLGLAVGPWPSAFAAAAPVPNLHAMHAQQAATQAPAPTADDHTMAVPCGGHAEPAQAAAAPGCCCDGDAGCPAAACAAMSCGLVHGASLPPAIPSVALLAAGTGGAHWISPPRVEPLAREPLRPPIA